MAEKTMADLAEPVTEAGPVPASVEAKRTKHYPSLYLDEEQLPALGKYEVGDEIALMFHAKITHKSETTNDQGSRCNYTIELTKGYVEAM